MNSDYDFVQQAVSSRIAKTVEREPGKNFCPVHLTYRPHAVRLNLILKNVIKYTDLASKKPEHYSKVNELNQK